MSGVFVSIGARAAVVIREFVRDGKAPVAELQNRLAETIGHGVIAHTKQVFARYSPIPSIPASAGSSRTRWRFAFHSGPYARLLGVRMELAPQDDGLGATDPYSQLDIALATAPTVTVGTANVHYGSSYGAYDDVPWNFGGGVRFLDDGLGDIEWILPDTEYVGTFYDYDHARLFGATVFEVSLQPDTDDGFPRANHGAGGSILDIDRQAASTMTRQLWARTAVPLWTGGSESNSTARSVVSDSTGGILAQSIGEFTLAATGTVDVQGVLSQSIGNFNLSAQGVMYTYDATVTTPADASSFDIAGGTQQLHAIVTVTVGGGAQDNAQFTVVVSDNYGGGSSRIDAVTTSALDGWSEGVGWVLAAGVASCTFGKFSVAVTSYTIEFDIQMNGACQLVISTNDDGPPFTDQQSGVGNDVDVDINDTGAP